MHLLRCFMPSLCALSTLFAGDAPPIMTVTIGDGARLIKRFDESLYAKLWQEQSLAPLREKFAEAIEQMTTEIGFSPVDAVRALRAAELTFVRMLPGDTDASSSNKPQPEMIGQADFGEFAERLMGLIEKGNNKNLSPIDIPGADTALSFISPDSKERLTFARYGSRLMFGANTESPPSPYTIKANEADAVMVLHYKQLVDAMVSSAPDAATAKNIQVLSGMEQFLKPLTWEMTILPGGIRERLAQDTQIPGLIAVDRTVFSHLPANTWMACAMGFDSMAYWQILEPVLIDLMSAQGKPMTAEQLKSQVVDSLQNLKLNLTFDELQRAIVGTILVSVSPGSPIPSFTVAIPRSKALDVILQFVANSQQMSIPEIGKSGQVILPNVPLPITMIQDPTYIVLSTDPQAASAWSASDGGWSQSSAIKTVFEQAPADAVIIGASDTPTVLRAVGGFFPFIPFEDPKDKQLATVLLARTAGVASTGYIFATSTDSSWKMETRGILGSVVLPLVSAIAIPGIMKTREVAVDRTVIATLRSQVFPAQIQFQGGGYMDQNQDGIGEYGFLHEMAGSPITNDPNSVVLNLLPEKWNATLPTIGGYTYACWLPDGKGGAISASKGPRTKIPEAATQQTARFVVYAWPASGAGKVFALTVNGNVYETDYAALELTDKGPAWNALFGGQGWDSEPVWSPYKRP